MNSAGTLLVLFVLLCGYHDQRGKPLIRSRRARSRGVVREPDIQLRSYLRNCLRNKFALDLASGDYSVDNHDCYNWEVQCTLAPINK